MGKQIEKCIIPGIGAAYNLPINLSGGVSEVLVDVIIVGDVRISIGVKSNRTVQSDSLT